MPNVCGTGGWSGPLPGDPDNSVTLTATAVFGGIDVTWTYPGTNPHAVAHTQLFRGITADFSNAILRDIVGGNRFYDKLSSDTTYYYWIKIVSVNGTVGTAIGPASATATTLFNGITSEFTGGIAYDMLTGQLKSTLGQISLLNENLAAEIFDREGGQTSFAAALAAVDAGVAEAHTFIETEITSRTAADAAVAEQVNLIAVTLGDGVAAVTITAEAAATRVLGLAAEYMVKVSAGGAVSGFGLAATEDPAGNSDSSFVVEANSFAVIAPYNYVQATTPNSPVENETWFNTSALPNADHGVSKRWNGTSWDVFTPTVPFGVDTTTHTVFINGNIRIGSGTGQALNTVGFGVDGDPGATGTRGTITTNISGAWNSATAVAQIYAVANGNGSVPTSPVKGDIVYYTGGAKVYSGSTWGDATFTLDGSMLATGTIGSAVALDTTGYVKANGSSGSYSIVITAGTGGSMTAHTSGSFNYGGSADVGAMGFSTAAAGAGLYGQGLDSSVNSFGTFGYGFYGGMGRSAGVDSTTTPGTTIYGAGLIGQAVGANTQGTGVQGDSNTGANSKAVWGNAAAGGWAFYGTGPIAATGNITANYSDDRLKTRLGKIRNALDKVDSLDTFYYKPNKAAKKLGYKMSREVGVSAQQVQVIMPEVVAPAPIDAKYLTVRYDRLLTLALAAIKELRLEVNQLKAAR